MALNVALKVLITPCYASPPHRHSRGCRSDWGGRRSKSRFTVHEVTLLVRSLPIRQIPKLVDRARNRTSVVHQTIVCANNWPWQMSVAAALNRCHSRSDFDQASVVCRIVVNSWRWPLLDARVYNRCHLLSYLDQASVGCWVVANNWPWQLSVTAAPHRCHIAPN